MSESNPPRICAIEQIEQYRALRRKFPDLSGICIYCVCPETSNILREEGVSFTEISDLAFQNQWGQINGWAKKTALSWFEDRKPEEVLKIEGINMGNVLGRPLTHLLIRQVKHMLLAEKILEGCRDKEAIVFINGYRRWGFFLRRESNTFNQLFDHLARRTGFRVVTTRCKVRPDRPFSLKTFVRIFLAHLWGFFGSKKAPCDVVASGALKHLLPVLERLGAGHRIALLGAQGFQRKDLNVCRQKGFAYLLPESVLTLRDYARLIRLMWGLKGRLAALRDILARGIFFTFQGCRVPLMEDVITEKIRRLWYVKCKLMLASRSLVLRFHPKIALLDEDVDWRRVLAMTFSRHGVRTYVLSHGIPPSTTDMSAFISNAGVGETIVNSQFEKEKYVMAGWIPAQLHVLGLPRYDTIFQLAKASAATCPAPSREPTVLYCPHMLTRRRKRKEGILGVHTPGNETRHNTLVLMEACKKIGCRLLIKPHSDAGDIVLWENLIRERGKGNVVLTSCHEDIFRLIAQSDVVVATFSTVLLEAVLFGKRAVSINFSGKPDVHPYVQKGIALGVTRQENLAGALQSCLEGCSRKSRPAEPSADLVQYFCGRNDGKSTERVVEFLLKKMAEQNKNGTEGCSDRMHYPGKIGVLAPAR